MNGLHMFFPLCTLSSHFAGGFCVQSGALSFVYSESFLRFLCGFTAVLMDLTPLRLLPVFLVSFKEFHVQVLCLSLWFLLNLYKCVRYWSSFILSLIFIQWSQFSLLQTLSFLHWVFRLPCQILVEWLCLGLFLDSLFCSTGLFFCFYISVINFWSL